jgi:hypothetical protein
MSLNELLDRLWIPIALAVILFGAQAAYLIRRSLRLDRSEERFGPQPAARAGIRESRRILLRAFVRALALVVLLFSSVYLLSTLSSCFGGRVS